jgi:hypothetical protein
VIASALHRWNRDRFLQRDCNRYGHLDRLGQEVISLIDPGGVPTAHLKIKCLRAMLDSMPDNISIKDLSQDWPTAS